MVHAAELKSRHRRPIASVQTDDGHLLIANRRSGSVTEIEVRDAATVVNEYEIGQQLSDFKRISKHRLVAIDEATHELIMLNRTADGLKVESRTPISPFPVSVQVDSMNNRITVASLWSQTLTLLQLPQPNQPLKTLAKIRLSFSPRKHLLLPEQNKVVVADAFGGKLAVIDLSSCKVESVRELPAHNIRHIVYQPADSTSATTTGEEKTKHPARIVLSHQFGNHLSRPTQDDIHWGMFLNNGLRSLQLDVVLNPKQRLLKNSRFEALGDIGRGAGDPGGFVFKDSTYAIAALSGVDDVIIAPTNHEPSFRVGVGTRPTQIIALQDGRFCVTNSLSDSISLLTVAERKDGDHAQNSTEGESDYASANRNRLYETNAKNKPKNATHKRVEVFDKITVKIETVSLGPAPPETDVERGERLFFNAKLSHDTWFSCHSCHTDGHSNGQLADTLTDGDYGAAKRVLSLRGVAETGPWAWNGKMETLMDQMHKSVQSTMQGPKINDQQATELVAFLQTFPPTPTIEQTNSELVNLKQIARGKAVFVSRGCVKCHDGQIHTTPKTYDVGLKDELGTNWFNPPSLRGVRFRERLFHDGRAESVEAVLATFEHQLAEPLTAKDLKRLLAYLNSL